MDGIRQYIISVCSAAVLCGIVKKIAGNSKASAGMIKLLTGLFVTICIISPWKSLSLDSLMEFNPAWDEDALGYVQQGQDMVNDSLCMSIKQETQAYILEKAQSMGIQVGVSIEVSDGDIPIPEKAIITGALSPAEKEVLSAFMVKELGIAKEMQIWI